MLKSARSSTLAGSLSLNEKREEGELKSLVGDFSVLSNPVRLRLLMKVHERGPCTLKELVDEAQRDESTVKRHLKELVEKGFLAKSNGKRPKYYITDKGVMAMTFLKVRAEPTALSKPVEAEEVRLRVRGQSVFSAFLYRLRGMGPKKLVFYSISLGCVVMGLTGLILANNVEILYRVLWLLMWLAIAYAFKALAT
jgi:DNA-binding MarR family transcriptional regulator